VRVCVCVCVCVTDGMPLPLLFDWFGKQGLLSGVFRQHLLDLGNMVESKITTDDLILAQKVDNTSYTCRAWTKRALSCRMVILLCASTRYGRSTVSIWS
jgi:hypothetical protein